MSEIKRNDQPDNCQRSAYPSPGRRLAGRWSRRHSARGIRGFVAAATRGLHTKLVRVQIDQHRPEIRFVIMVGVMRSGSSMLSQILCSHPDIVGFGETHTTYDGDEGFIELIRRNLWIRHAWRVRRARYFDKVLHAELIPDMALLAQMPVDWIVLRRKGEPCVQSMMRTLSMSAEHACDYFVHQSTKINQWVNVLQEHPTARVVQVAYEDLVNDTNQTLTRLSSELALDPVLRSDYRVQKGVLRAGANDPSGNFLKGHIERVEHKQISLDEALLNRLLTCDECNEKLAQLIEARVLDSSESRVN